MYGAIRPAEANDVPSFVARIALIKAVLVIALRLAFELACALYPAFQLVWQEIPGLLGIIAIFTFINLDIVFCRAKSCLNIVGFCIEGFLVKRPTAI